MNKQTYVISAGAIILIGILVVLGITGRLGSGGHQAVRAYVSSSFDVAFDYPEEGYTLDERRESFEDSPLLVVTLTEKDATVADASEGPPVISLVAASNASSTPLEEWVRTKSPSRFSLATDKTLASTTVAGEPAVRYHYSGLYETDAVAVAHDGKVYVFSVAWSDANATIRQVFENLLQSVTFTS